MITTTHPQDIAHDLTDLAEAFERDSEAWTCETCWECEGPAFCGDAEELASRFAEDPQSTIPHDALVDQVVGVEVGGRTVLHLAAGEQVGVVLPDREQDPRGRAAVVGPGGAYCDAAGVGVFVQAYLQAARPLPVRN